MLLHAVIFPCLEVGNLSKFTALLKSIDPSLESFHSEMSAASDYFINRKMYNVAYIFQDMLKVGILFYFIVYLFYFSRVSSALSHYHHYYYCSMPH